MYKQIVQPILFQLSPESAHSTTTTALQVLNKLPGTANLLNKLYGTEQFNLQKTVMGLQFKNPVGLAAGFDKNADYITEFSQLGFGCIEVGTVTPKPQPGNAKPRLFRLPKDKALINRMGFNNNGVEAMVAKLNQLNQCDVIIGGNIGKNKTTPNAEAVNDYLICFNALHEYVDYFVVNVSSPNTPNLRDLQQKDELAKILTALQNQNAKLAKPKPILVKLSPDVNEEQLQDMVDVVQQTELSGVVATNTTISRKSLKTENQTIEQIGAGGLSGAPLRVKSTQTIQLLRNALGKEAIIIGVGGIASGEDALEKLKAGADLIQVYTGFIYEGPKLIQSICKKIQEDAEKL